MAAVVLLTRFLLGCLISEITYAAALPTERGKTPESWPPLYWGPHPPAQTWGRPVVPTWQPPGGWHVPDRRPFLLQNPTAVKNMVPPERPQKRIPVATPRTFQIKLQAPVSNTEDTSMGEDYSQSKGLNKFHLETQLESPSKVHSHTGSIHNPKGSSQSAFHLSLSVPISTTTKAPGIKVITQKPPESKLVSFFSGLLGQKGQGNQNSASGSLSGHHHTPTNNWMDQMHLHSTDSGSAVQDPVPQAVQNVHHSHRFPLANSDNADVSSILQSAKYVNGQLMIPLEKCPGLEQFLQNHHHHHQGHGHHHHHHQGHGHHHHHHQGRGHHHHHHQGRDHHHHQGRDHHHHQGHDHHHHHQGHDHHHHHQGHDHHHHHQGHDHHHHHQGHDHHHHHHHHQGHGQTKPHHTKFFLNMEGSAPNPKEQWQGKENPVRFCKSCGTPANPVSGGYQHSKTDQTRGQFVNPLAHASYVPDSQQSIMKPGQTNYMVQLGGNVEYDQQPDAQSHNHFQYVQQRKM